MPGPVRANPSYHGMTQSNSQLNKDLFSALLGISVTWVVVGSVLLWIRRGKHPIKARQPWLLLMFNLVVLCGMILMCVHRMLSFGFQCSFVNVHVACLYYASFPMRAFILWVRFERVQRLMYRSHNSKKSTTRSPRSVSSFSSLSSVGSRTISARNIPTEYSSDSFCPQNLGDLISIKSISIYILLACVFALWPIPVLGLSLGCERSINVSNAISLAQNLVLLIFCAVLAFKLRKEYDYFWLKAEFVGEFIISILAVPLLIVFRNSNQETFAISAFISMLVFLFFVFYSTYMPVILSFRRDRDSMAVVLPNIKAPDNIVGTVSSSSERKKNSIEALLNVLNDAEGLCLFKKFLIGEMSVENLLFYCVVTDLNKRLKDETKSVSSKAEFADEIFSKFVAENARYAINISHETRNKITANLKTIHATDNNERVSELLQDLYTESLNEILTLMSRDSFMRFRRIPEAKKYFKKMQMKQAFVLNDLV